VLALNDATLRRWTYEYWQTLPPQATDSSEIEEMEEAP
jgi:hypothetical protein